MQIAIPEACYHFGRDHCDNSTVKVIFAAASSSSSFATVRRTGSRLHPTVVRAFGLNSSFAAIGSLSVWIAVSRTCRPG